MDLVANATRYIPHPPEAVFDYAVGPTNLARIFIGHGPIPAIKKAQMRDGAPFAEGNVLSFVGSDGVELFHRIDRIDRARAYEYDLHGLKAPFSLLVKAGYARWTFAPEGAGTRVDWSYTFPLTSPLAYPLARVVIGVFMRKAMERCLAQVDDQLAHR